jgi:nitrilase
MTDQTAPQSSKVKVAVTQLEPEWLDLAASVKKTCDYITEAAQNNAKLVSFAEAFIPGYPAWIW